MTTTDVLVVGAGPTGFTAADVLARHGVDFGIIDREIGPTEETRALRVQRRTSRGSWVQRRGLRAPAHPNSGRSRGARH